MNHQGIVVRNSKKLEKLIHAQNAGAGSTHSLITSQKTLLKGVTYLLRVTIGREHTMRASRGNMSRQTKD